MKRRGWLRGGYLAPEHVCRRPATADHVALGSVWRCPCGQAWTVREDGSGRMRWGAVNGELGWVPAHKWMRVET